MLTRFDWLRRAFTGAELMGTLHCIARNREELLQDTLGPPFSALDGPCDRCRVYARKPGNRFCPACLAIRSARLKYSVPAQYMIVVWGHVNQMPRYLRGQNMAPDQARLAAQGPGGCYVLDESRFLHVLIRRELQAWLQDLLLYDGGELRGFIQISPTTGVQPDGNMADVLCHLINREATQGMQQLRLRFYPTTRHVRWLHLQEAMDQLTFSATDFLSILDMAVVFRKLLFRNEQEMLRQLLTTKDLNQEQFYWGRFLAMINQPARDMLHAWRIRHWSPTQVQLFYHVLTHVCVDFRPQATSEPSPA